MISLAFSVRDVVSSTYGRPFFSQNENTAMRSCAMEVNNPNPDSVLSTNPDDFELYVIGTFDDETGLIQPLAAPKLITRCSLLVKPAAPVSAS